MAGERERGGGAPEKEGGAARGRSGGAHGCDGGSKVIVRRSKRTIWSGSAAAVGDCSGFPSLSFFNFFCTLVLIWEWKIFALHSCKNCEQVHPLVSLLLSDEFDFGFGSIASIWSYEVSNYILSFLPTILISGCQF
ncbi:hypothetical protein P8452_33017 [Trifolium repens]|nr:hypothetical protein P8452_33017 [Trifolium repens]